MNMFEQRKKELQPIVDYLARRNVNAAYIGGGLMEVIYKSKRTLIFACMNSAYDYQKEIAAA